MSKPLAPAKSAAPKTKIKAPQKAVAKSTVKTAPVKKMPAKKSVVPKAVAKPAAKPAARPVAKPAAKSANKPASTPANRPAASPLSKPTSKPTTKSAPKIEPKVAPKPAAKALPKPIAAKPTATKPSTKAAAKPEAARPTAAPVAKTAPAPNRFTDRFAPARHMAKTEPEAFDQMKPAAKVDPKVANAWKNKPGRELSEPELLAMPDGEYMSDKQIDYFRKLLIGQKDDLLSNAGETTEHLREDTTIVPDPADRATIEEEHALELRTRDRERKLLKKIAQSLTRLENGEYGFCDETGEPIGLARLLARPTATLSLEAQQRREMKQKMFGD